MSDKIHKNIILAARYFPNLCINIDEYISMTLDPNKFSRLIDMYMDDERLSKGLFCKLLNSNIWVSKIAIDGHIRVSNREEPSIKDEADWSPNLSLENFNKLLELKAFW